MTTVLSSVAFALSSSVRSDAYALNSFALYQFNVHATSFAENGFPSDHLMPGRRW